jgi:hypothetical protein
MVATLAIPKDTTKAMDATDLIERFSSGATAIAFHPFLTTAATDQTDINIFNSPEILSFPYQHVTGFPG